MMEEEEEGEGMIKEGRGEEKRKRREIAREIVRGQDE